MLINDLEKFLSEFSQALTLLLAFLERMNEADESCAVFWLYTGSRRQVSEDLTPCYIPR